MLPSNELTSKLLIMVKVYSPFSKVYSILAYNFLKFGSPAVLIQTMKFSINQSKISKMFRSCLTNVFINSIEWDSTILTLLDIIPLVLVLLFLWKILKFVINVRLPCNSCGSHYNFLTISLCKREGIIEKTLSNKTTWESRLIHL